MECKQEERREKKAHTPHPSGAFNTRIPFYLCARALKNKKEHASVMDVVAADDAVMMDASGKDHNSPIPSSEVFNYVVTAHKPTAVSYSCVGRFTHLEKQNLIVARSNRIEIYLLTEEGLEPVLETTVYGRIAMLKLCEGSTFGDKEKVPGRLVVVTEDRYSLAVLSYDSATNTLQTISSGDVSDLTGRPVEHGMLGDIDQNARVIALHIYDGLLKFIPFDENGNLLQAFNANLNELKVLDFVFLPSTSSSSSGITTTTSENENNNNNNFSPEDMSNVSSLTRSINRENAGGVGANSMPVIAVLHKDVKDERHVSTYRVNLRDRDLEPGPFEQREVEIGSKKLLALSSPIGGCVVVGEETIAYLNEPAGTTDDQENNDNNDNTTTTTNTTMTTGNTILKNAMHRGECKSSSSALVRAITTPDLLMFSSACLIPSDENVSNQLIDRFLIADEDGDLYLLMLSKGTTSDSMVSKLTIERLGKTSSASAISYLDNSVVFIGSAYGDSQIIKLHTEQVNTMMSDSNELPSYVEVLEEFTNLGPIVDFCVMDLERHGQGQLVTCSGVGRSGSLRVIRNGIGIREQAQIPLSGIKGLYSCKRDETTTLDSYLIVSFIAETRILAINNNDELEEAVFSGFDAASQTIECANVSGNTICQVTSRGVYVCDASSGELVASWVPSDESPITAGSASENTIAVATVGGKLYYLSLQNGKIKETGKMTCDAEISCIDKTRCGDRNLCAVGLWSTKVLLVELESEMKVCHTENLSLDVVPRSTLFCSFEDTTYLLTGLGDGHLITNVVVSSNSTNEFTLSDRKSVSLGTQPVTLKLFKSQHSMHVFAGSDRPTIIYSNSKKLVYSNVNLNEVLHVAPFNCDAFPDALALASGEHLTIGAVDDIQKLHIRTVPLREQPRRIAHQPETKTLAVLTMKENDVPGREEEFFVRLFDDQTFETLAKYPLEPNENDASIISCSFDGDDDIYFVVGTAFADPHSEPESSRGRILVFKVSNTASSGGGNGVINGNGHGDGAQSNRASASSSVLQKNLTLVCEKETRGAVYNLNAFCGKLLAGINSLVKLFNWGLSKENKRELVHECSHMGHIIALKVETKDNLIVVGDLMKSITLLEYQREYARIEEIAHDFSSNWMTAVEILDDNTYLGAESSYNLFTVQRNADADTEDKRGTLELCGTYHLGDSVNRFRRGSLVMRMPDQSDDTSSFSEISTWLFGTISGGLGVVATLPKLEFLLLNRVQEAMQKVVTGVGNFSHSDFRCFHNVQRSVKMQNFIDGDLVEIFLDLTREDQEAVSKLCGVSNSEDLVKKIEELSRLTH